MVLRVHESIVRTHPESNPSTQPKHSSKQSAPLWQLPKGVSCKKRKIQTEGKQKEKNIDRWTLWWVPNSRGN